MSRKEINFIVILALFVPAFFITASQNVFKSSWSENKIRYYLGQSCYSNRLQDWRINNGKLECVQGWKPLRTVHLLTHYMKNETGSIKVSVISGEINKKTSLTEDDFRGFLIGVGNLEMDYRARAIIHQASGKGGGLICALDGTGEIKFYDNENNLNNIEPSQSEGNPVEDQNEELKLKVLVKPLNNSYSITMSVYNLQEEVLQSKTISNISPSRLTGNIALIANGGIDEKGKSFYFNDWEVEGSKIGINKNQKFGPIIATLHTLSRNVLKLTVQLAPISDTDSKEVYLQVREVGEDKWKSIKSEEVIIPGWTATFRIPDWNSKEDFEYRIVYSFEGRDHYYEGLIPHNPVKKDEIVVAAFTGNSNSHTSFGNNFNFAEHIWFPHNEVTEHVSDHQPDLLVYTGDQVYDGRPVTPDRSGEESSYLDYMYKWYHWCWAHGQSLARNIPAVCIPDDHDYYHGNIWGAGGIKIRKVPNNEYENPLHDWGGFIMPSEWVDMVERTQTSHLPDPYDSEPVAQGINVYYTDLNYGGISFAILEDRKFKSSPTIQLPGGNVVNGFALNEHFDVCEEGKVPSASLLGARQLMFIDNWASNWEGSWMKVALSQTVLACVHTYPDTFKTDAGTPHLKPLPKGVIPKDYKKAQDMDSNGWPQSGRNRALKALRKGFSFMICGDSHLANIVHHGVNDWDDSGFSFCVPAIANLWPRRWFPPEPGENHKKGMPIYTGSYFDGLCNRITVWAVANPHISGKEPAPLHDRSPGYGIIKLNKKEQTIKIECWPRYADPNNPESKQYPGWPLTINMEENYGRKPSAYLPTIKFTGIEYPVIQVIKEPLEKIIYTRRLKGTEFQPGVFEAGIYKVRIGEPGEIMKEIKGLKTIKKGEKKVIEIDFKEKN
jgi:hypothetical protein